MMYLKKPNMLPFYKVVSIVLIVLALPFQLNGQVKSDSSEVYNINPWITGAIGIGGIIISQEMLKRLADADPIPVDEILALDKSQVNSFDRRAVEQTNYSYAPEAHRISDYWLIGSVLLPASLFIDPKIRKHWLKISLMYLETQAISSNLYIWGGPMLKERFRPVTYYNEGQFDIGDITHGRNRHSFFSGHVENTAAGTFFWAKVLTDYHPEWNGKWKIWAAASVPPVMVGYLRYRALKHFPTDLIVGFIVGGGTGILVPHLHKKKELKRLNMSLFYNDENMGFSARWTIK